MPNRPSWALGASPPGTGFTISRRTFDQIVNLIEDNTASIQRMRLGVDTMVNLMVVIVRSEAMKQSFGPVAARQRSNPALAYRIPVQRITGAYYAGWYVRRRGHGRWVVGNATKEAYLIETGLFQRVRRPILKNSAINMLRLLQTSRALEMFGDSILAPRRGANGAFRSFENRVRPFALKTTAIDLPNRGAANPNITGPRGVLPR